MGVYAVTPGFPQARLEVGRSQSHVPPIYRTPQQQEVIRPTRSYHLHLAGVGSDGHVQRIEVAIHGLTALEKGGQFCRTHSPLEAEARQGHRSVVKQPLAQGSRFPFHVLGSKKSDRPLREQFSRIMPPQDPVQSARMSFHPSFVNTVPVAPFAMEGVIVALLPVGHPADGPAPDESQDR